MNVISQVFNIIFTMIIYLVIPITLVLIGKPLSRIKMNMISLINLIVGIFISSVIVYYLSSGLRFGLGGGSLLWVLVGNILMKKKLSLSNDPADIRWRKKEEQTRKKNEALISSGKYASLEDMDKRHAIIGLSIIAFVFVGFIIFVYCVSLYRSKM